MIKNKLHTISDDDAIKVGEILLTSSTSSLFNFEFIKIRRNKYEEQDGVDADESVNVYFKATLKNKTYELSGWKDKEIIVSLIERDRYHNYPYFNASSRTSDLPENHYTSHEYVSNYVEAIEYLQSKKLI